jgi:outer membrane beta-barrel protein
LAGVVGEAVIVNPSEEIQKAMKKIVIATAVVMALLSLSFPAFAEENERIHVLQKKLYTLDGKHDITPFFATSINDKYTSHIGGGLSYSYHLFESLALQVDGMYVNGDETSLTKELKELFQKNPIEPQRMQFKYYAGGDVLWYPIYGKFSLVSELALHYNFYFIGGAGVVGTRVFDPAQGKTVDRDSALFAGNVGAGMQLFIIRWLCLKLEFRDIIYTATGNTLAGNTLTKESNTRNNMMFVAGVGFLL